MKATTSTQALAAKQHAILFIVNFKRNEIKAEWIEKETPGFIHTSTQTVSAAGVKKLADRHSKSDLGTSLFYSRRDALKCLLAYSQARQAELEDSLAKRKLLTQSMKRELEACERDMGVN